MVFEAALSREATDAEVKGLTQLVGEPPNTAGLADALWCVIMLPEFQLVR
jgi:hypothetical protein